MELWQNETAKYNARLKSIKNWNVDLPNFMRKLPDSPFKGEPPVEKAVAVTIVWFTAGGCVRYADQCVKAFMKLWESGLFSTITLPARLIYELWASTHYALRVLDDVKDSKNLERAHKRTQQLFLGARSDLTLPWGDIPAPKCIHIMDFVRSLSNVYPETQDTYSFLCESCHPSYVQLMNWSLAGPPNDNWSNPNLQRIAHNLIDRTLTAMEMSLSGICEDTTNAFNTASIYFEM